MARVVVTTRNGVSQVFEGDNIGIEHNGDHAVRVFEYTPYKLLGVFYNPDSVIKS